MSDSFTNSTHFLLTNFQQRRAFSSFLPGIAGLRGIPMWVFYVNRGQGIASFGVESKDHPILEYQCAQRAYQCVSQVGFRTFLKGERAGFTWTYEPFAGAPSSKVKRNLQTGLNEFLIEEVNEVLGLKTSVSYFLLPNEPFAALVRQVEFSNIGDGALKLEAIDGLPVMSSYGIPDWTLKHMGRTIEAWIEVLNLEQNLPFFHIKASSDDKLHVEVIKAGNFAMAYEDGKSLPVLVDTETVFGVDTAFEFPRTLKEEGLAALLAKNQVVQGRTPCAMFGARMEIPVSGKRSIISLYGQAAALEVIQAHANRMLEQGYIERKLDETRKLALELTDAVKTESSSALFDGFCRQNYLDNVMRGGVPLVLGGKHVFHTYSRRHGDLERDYNFFVVAPEYYSQGNGSFRDINQNRRSDVFFNPKAGEFNIRLFMSLIQSDGYNPLTLQGSTFTIPSSEVEDLVSKAKNQTELKQLFAGEFTPGQLLEAAMKANLLIPEQEFLESVFANAEQHLQAVHGEGYWCDHWSYNLDLVEANLTIFPEEKERLLFDSMLLPFYDDSHRINPRSERFVLDDGQPRQFNVVFKDEQKEALIESRKQDRFWSRAGHGKGEIFKLPLVSKMALVAILKYSALDPSGFGVMMEGGKPGWYDALNGIPALFGSSMPDSYELLRLIHFLIQSLQEVDRKVMLPIEGIELTDKLTSCLTTNVSSMECWQILSDAVEHYRENTRFGFDGACRELDLLPVFNQMQERLTNNLKEAEALAGELPATYFIHEARHYVLTGRKDEEGRSIIHITDFEPKPLPTFLEGPVRRTRTLDAKAVGELYHKIRKSDLFDKKLHMYRLNTSLERMPHEIGRARAFTPGWLENESIWLHMDFKYLLELLRAGLYEVFYEELKAHLPAFMDVDVYGRSPLENSSFIASSAHPDPAVHGNGFVARLSGSTAEFISMWVMMTMGHKPFVVNEGELKLKLHPNLPGWLFKEDGSFSFRMLNYCHVTLFNPQKLDTFNCEPKEFILKTSDGEVANFKTNTIPAPYASMMRQGKIISLEVRY